MIFMLCLRYFTVVKVLECCFLREFESCLRFFSLSLSFFQVLSNVSAYNNSKFLCQNVFDTFSEVVVSSKYRSDHALMVESCICYLVFFFQLPVLSCSWPMGWSPTLTHRLMVFTTVLQPLTLVTMDTSWSVIQQGFVISLGVPVHGEEQTELAVVRRFSVTYTTLFNCVTWHLQLQLIC